MNSLLNFDSQSLLNIVVSELIYGVGIGDQEKR